MPSSYMLLTAPPDSRRAASTVVDATSAPSVVASGTWYSFSSSRSGLTGWARSRSRFTVGAQYLVVEVVEVEVGARKPRELSPRQSPVVRAHAAPARPGQHSPRVRPPPGRGLPPDKRRRTRTARLQSGSDQPDTRFNSRSSLYWEMLPSCTQSTTCWSVKFESERSSLDLTEAGLVSAEIPAGACAPDSFVIVRGEVFSVELAADAAGRSVRLVPCSCRPQARAEELVLLPRRAAASEGGHHHHSCACG